VLLPLPVSNRGRDVGAVLHAPKKTVGVHQHVVLWMSSLNIPVIQCVSVVKISLRKKALSNMVVDL
jgi:hypothetical protein